MMDSPSVHTLHSLSNDKNDVSYGGLAGGKVYVEDCSLSMRTDQAVTDVIQEQTDEDFEVSIKKSSKIIKLKKLKKDSKLLDITTSASKNYNNRCNVNLRKDLKSYPDITTARQRVFRVGIGIGELHYTNPWNVKRIAEGGKRVSSGIVRGGEIIEEILIYNGLEVLGICCLETATVADVRYILEHDVDGIDLHWPYGFRFYINGRKIFRKKYEWSHLILSFFDDDVDIVINTKHAEKRLRLR